MLTEMAIRGDADGVIRYGYGNIWVSIGHLGRTVVPRGRSGERRPADVVGCAVRVAKIATGEIEETRKSGRVRPGKAGGQARAAGLSKERRHQIAKKAAQARWRNR